jgi:hypothetical protein
MEPAHHLAASYYERWLFIAERRLQRKGTIAPGGFERMTERLEAGEPVAAYHDAAMAERIMADLTTLYPIDAPNAVHSLPVSECASNICIPPATRVARAMSAALTA